MEASTVMKASNTLVAGREVASSEVVEDIEDGETIGSGRRLTPEVTEEDPAEDTDSSKQQVVFYLNYFFFKYFLYSLQFVFSSVVVFYQHEIVLPFQCY
jgi:hypothetical protein